MYNVEEAYLNTLNAGTQVFKKMCTTADQSIKKRISKGYFTDIFNLEHKDYPVKDIDRLEDFFNYLGYGVTRTELTNDVTQLTVSWTGEDAKKYLDKDQN